MPTTRPARGQTSAGQGIGLLLLAGACWLAIADPLAAGPPDPREEQALELAVTAVASEDPAVQVEAVRKLAAFPYPSVAFALVQLAQESEEPAVLRELEWALVAQSQHALEPLVTALQEGLVPTVLATVVLKRIARQEPVLVTPFLAHDNPSVARAAALAVALCGHPDAPARLASGISGFSPAARVAVLEALCHEQRPQCQELLATALRDEEEEVVVSALTLLPDRAPEAARAALLPLLHRPSELIVRAALERLGELGAGGAEKDLEILLQETPEYLQLQVLELLAATNTRSAVELLGRRARELAPESLPGRTARALFAAAAERVVLRDEGTRSVPVAAVLSTGDSGEYLLRLYGEEGFRVVARGDLLWQCRGARSNRVAVRQEDFLADGNYLLKVTCPRGGGAPEVQWRRRDGHQLRARIEGLE